MTHGHNRHKFRTGLVPPSPISEETHPQESVYKALVECLLGEANQKIMIGLSLSPLTCCTRDREEHKDHIKKWNYFAESKEDWKQLAQYVR